MSRIAEIRHLPDLAAHVAREELEGLRAEAAERQRIRQLTIEPWALPPKHTCALPPCATCGRESDMSEVFNLAIGIAPSCYACVFRE